MIKSLAVDCEPHINTQTQHLYNVLGCSDHFDSGFGSHIRGKGHGLQPISHIFPGDYPLGNVAGANGPIYIANPDFGYIVQLKRRYDGTPSDYRIWERNYDF